MLITFMRSYAPFVLLILTSLWGFPRQISAGEIFESGTPDLPGGTSYNIGVNRVADDFNLDASANVTSIAFLARNVPPQFGGVVSWAFYTPGPSIFGDSAAPGSLLFSGSSSASVSMTGQMTQYGDPVYRLDFPTSAQVILYPGTYWLEVHDGPTVNSPNDDFISWLITQGFVAQNSGVNGLLGEIPDTPTYSHFAFQLLGDSPVPEPTSAILAFCGLAGLIILSRRGSRRSPNGPKQ